MNDLKKPTSLVAGTNIILTVGSFAYLYKQLELLKEENDKLRGDMRSLTSKLQNITGTDVQNQEMLKHLHKDVRTLKSQVPKLDVDDEIKAIKYALTDADIDIKSPIRLKKKKYRISSEEESEESIETPKKKRVSKKKEDENEDLIRLYRKHS